MTSGTTPSTGQLATVTYIAGINANGTVAAASFADWNGQTPAGYDTTAGYANKWDNNAAGNGVALYGAAGVGGGTVTYGFAVSDTQAQRQAFIDTVTLWSDEANIQFVQAPAATADLLFDVKSGGGTFQEGAPQQASVAGSSQIPAEVTPSEKGGGQSTIQFDKSGLYGVAGSFTVKGGYGVSAVTHEVGHALGLGHSGPYDDGAATNPDLVQNSAFDSRQWSVMSYIDPSDTAATYAGSYTVKGTNWAISTPGPGGTTAIDEASPETPMPLDILAVQRLYGAATSGGLQGGQVFGFHCNVSDAARPFFDFTQNVTPVVTLWDAGKGNTLDVSGFGTGSTINLNAGSFSSAGGLSNNIGIAFGTVIDTAVGGGGNDVFVVNGDGDAIAGGGGTDTVVYGGARSAYTVAAGTTGQPTIVTETATGARDTLYGIAALQFSDQAVMVGPAATTAGGTTGTGAAAGNPATYDPASIASNAAAVFGFANIGAPAFSSAANLDATAAIGRALSSTLGQPQGPSFIGGLVAGTEIRIMANLAQAGTSTAAISQQFGNDMVSLSSVLTPGASGSAAAGYGFLAGLVQGGATGLAGGAAIPANLAAVLQQAMSVNGTSTGSVAGCIIGAVTFTQGYIGMINAGQSPLTALHSTESSSLTRVSS